MINFSRSTATIPVTEILPHRSLFSGLNLREVWQYRDLFYFLLWRDVKAQYAQSVLGVGWALIRPVFTMLVFTVISASWPRSIPTACPTPSSVSPRWCPGATSPRR